MSAAIRQSGLLSARQAIKLSFVFECIAAVTNEIQPHYMSMRIHKDQTVQLREFTGLNWTVGTAINYLAAHCPVRKGHSMQ
jgi:hypothetical protein